MFCISVHIVVPEAGALYKVKLKINLPVCGKSVVLLNLPLMFRYWGMAAETEIESISNDVKEIKTKGIKSACRFASWQTDLCNCSVNLLKLLINLNISELKIVKVIVWKIS